VTLIPERGGNVTPPSAPQTEMRFVSRVTAPVNAKTLPDTLTPAVTVARISAKTWPVK